MRKSSPPDPLQNLFAENPLPPHTSGVGRGSFTKRFGGGFGRRPFLKRSLPSISVDNIINSVLRDQSIFILFMSSFLLTCF